MERSVGPKPGRIRNQMLILLFLVSLSVCWLTFIYSSILGASPIEVEPEPAMTKEMSIANELLRARFMNASNAATAKVAVVTLHMWKDSPIWTECSFRQSKVKYCAKHGYALLDENLFEPILEKALPLRPWMLPPDKTPRYRKLQYLEMILRARLPFKWLLWVDGDTVFTNPSYTVEDRLRNVRSKLSKPNRNPVFVIAKDQTSVNNGVWLIRNTREAHKAIIDIFNEENNVRHHWADQLSLLNFMKSHRQFVRQRMLVLPHTIQFHWQAYEHHKKRTMPWILHLAGMDMQKRKSLLMHRGLFCATSTEKVTTT